MNVNERLYIGNATASVIKASCKLTYRMPGSATFITDVEPNMQQMIAYEFGYNHQLVRWFTGYVESYQETGKNQYTLFCRELVGVFRYRFPVSMQHVTLLSLTKELEVITGLTIMVPNVDYSETPAPHIINLDTGYALLDSLGAAYSINDYFWQQQGDGRLYIGSWKDSAWSKMKNIPLPPEVIKLSGINAIKIPAIPQLRPGVIINNNRVRSIELENSYMVVTWMTK